MHVCGTFPSITVDHADVNLTSKYQLILESRPPLTTSGESNIKCKSSEDRYENRCTSA